MMFTTIKKAWEEQAFSSSIIKEFLSMLDSSEEMLVYALKTLVKRGKGSKKQEEIYAKDKGINLTEQDIRRKIMAHLKTHPEGNLPSCLMLISISKDAERIGDHCKNLIELRDIPDVTSEDNTLFVKLFDTTGAQLIELIHEVKRSFKKGDRKRAQAAMEMAHTISDDCESIISETAESSYCADHAVVLTLGSRYMKRIACHLSNIVSSVYNPLTSIDFHNTSAAQK